MHIYGTLVFLGTSKTGASKDLYGQPVQNNPVKGIN